MLFKRVKYLEITSTYVIFVLRVQDGEALMRGAKMT